MRPRHASAFALIVAVAAACGSSGDEGAGDAGTGGAGAGSTSRGSTSTSASHGAGGHGSSSDASSSAGGAAPKPATLIFGPDVADAVKARVTALVEQASGVAPIVAPPDVVPTGVEPGSLVLAFGDTAATSTLVTDTEVDAAGPEGFVVRHGAIGAATLVAERGNPGDRIVFGDIGTSYGAYAVLERLGFAFLHPLAPVVPRGLKLAAAVDASESPAWPVRGWHLHTMHPLELTDLLQGFGPGGTGDPAGWAAMLPEWDLFLEWMLANRQNRVEWPLLWADSYKDFADGDERIGRLAQLVDAAHARGLAAGLDVPIALQQQHAMRLVRDAGELDAELQQIRDRLTHLFGAGFDFVSTESGSTEFTHPDPARMLAWMNEVATFSRDQFDARAYIKAHCSTGQTADGYPDPTTGQPINFNFLPHYADPALGVMPHTVEMYGLSDPAPTYGNTDFGYMKDFLEQEVGSRETLWHPETAYWVTYDIDVPLFLPIYAERRVSDLRALAADQSAGLMGRGAHAGKKMDGQFVFSSGWEWGYWLNDVVTARASWDPHVEAATDREAFLSILEPAFAPFGDLAGDAAALVADVADAEAELLIRGEVAGVAPSDITKRSGMAYLEGFDAMADIATLGHAAGVSFSPVTQPARRGLVDMRNPFDGGPSYTNEIAPLLEAMATRFGVLADRAAALASAAPPGAKDLADDIADAAKMTALRARQMKGLYAYVDGFPLQQPDANRMAQLADARAARQAAQDVVAAREPRYRVPADRIAAWRPNPTAYDFTYLWTTRSLYFWWRDEAKAVLAPANPCYLNIMNPVDIGMGEGTGEDLVQIIHQAYPGDATECLAAPTSEPTYPPPGL